MTTTSLPRVPEGLRDLMKVYTKEVLREKPADLYGFSAKFFNLIVAEKSHQVVRKYEPVQTYETIMKNRIKQQVPISMVFNIIPETLTDLIKKFIKAVLREKPENIYIFAQEYFQRLSKEKSGRIEYTKYSTYEKSIKDKENIAPVSKVTCECGRVLSAQSKDLTKAVSTETTKLGTTITEETTLSSSISYVKSVVVIQRHFRRYLKQKKIGREKNKCNSVEYMTAIILIQRQFRRVLAKRRVEKLKKSRPGQLSYVKFNAANYMKAVVVIQRHYRIYLKRKQEQNRLKNGPVSLATAALIIQRAFRRMVAVRRARRTASVTADPGEELNDNASETGSYTSVSTALLSTESTELGMANYEEKVHQKIIHEDEEVENNNVDASLEKEYLAETIKGDDKSIGPRKSEILGLEREKDLNSELSGIEAEKPLSPVIEDEFTPMKESKRTGSAQETAIKTNNNSLEIKEENEMLLESDSEKPAEIEDEFTAIKAGSKLDSSPETAEIEDEFTAIKAGSKEDSSPETELSKKSSLDLQEKTNAELKTLKASIEELQLEIKDDLKAIKDQELENEVKTEDGNEDSANSKGVVLEGNTTHKKITSIESEDIKELVSTEIEDSLHKQEEDKDKDILIKATSPLTKLTNSESQEVADKPIKTEVTPKVSIEVELVDDVLEEDLSDPYIINPGNELSEGDYLEEQPRSMPTVEIDSLKTVLTNHNREVQKQEISKEIIPDEDTEKNEDIVKPTEIEAQEEAFTAANKSTNKQNREDSLIKREKRSLDDTEDIVNHSQPENVESTDVVNKSIEEFPSMTEEKKKIEVVETQLNSVDQDSLEKHKNEVSPLTKKKRSLNDTELSSPKPSFDIQEPINPDDAQIEKEENPVEKEQQGSLTASETIPEVDSKYKEEVAAKQEITDLVDAETGEITVYKPLEEITELSKQEIASDQAPQADVISDCKNDEDEKREMEAEPIVSDRINSLETSELLETKKEEAQIINHLEEAVGLLMEPKTNQEQTNIEICPEESINSIENVSGDSPKVLEEPGSLEENRKLSHQETMPIGLDLSQVEEIASTDDIAVVETNSIEDTNIELVNSNEEAITAETTVEDKNKSKGIDEISTNTSITTMEAESERSKRDVDDSNSNKNSLDPNVESATQADEMGVTETTGKPTADNAQKSTEGNVDTPALAVPEISKEEPEIIQPEEKTNETESFDPETLSVEDRKLMDERSELELDSLKSEVLEESDNRISIDQSPEITDNLMDSKEKVMSTSLEKTPSMESFKNNEKRAEDCTVADPALEIPPILEEENTVSLSGTDPEIIPTESKNTKESEIPIPDRPGEATDPKQQDDKPIPLTESSSSKDTPNDILESLEETKPESDLKKEDSVADPSASQIEDAPSDRETKPKEFETSKVEQSKQTSSLEDTITPTSNEKVPTSTPSQTEKKSSLLVSNQLIGTQNLPTNRNEIEKNTKKLSSASVKDKDIGTSGRLVPTPIAELQLKSFKAPNDDGAWYDIYVEPQQPSDKDLHSPPPAASVSTNQTEKKQDITPEMEPIVVAERVPSYYTPKEILEPSVPKAKNSISFFVSFDSDDGKPKYKIPKKFRDQSKSDTLADTKSDPEPENNEEDIEVIEVSEGDPEYQQMGGSKLQTIMELNENECNNEGSTLHGEETESSKDLIDKEKSDSESFIRSGDLKLESSTKTDTEHYESVYKTDILNLTRSVQIIERAYRRFKNRRSLKRQEITDNKKKNNAAKVIQKWVRDFLIKKSPKVTSDISRGNQESLAARKIQRAYRRYVEKAKGSNLEKEFILQEEAEKEKRAALIIQKAFRAYSQKNLAKSKNESSDNIKLKENQAARKIQRAYRRYLRQANKPKVLLDSESEPIQVYKSTENNASPKSSALNPDEIKEENITQEDNSRPSSSPVEDLSDLSELNQHQAADKIQRAYKRYLQKTHKPKVILDSELEEPITVYKSTEVTSNEVKEEVKTQEANSKPSSSHAQDLSGLTELNQHQAAEKIQGAFRRYLKKSKKAEIKDFKSKDSVKIDKPIGIPSQSESLSKDEGNRTANAALIIQKAFRQYMERRKLENLDEISLDSITSSRITAIENSLCPTEGTPSDSLIQEEIPSEDATQISPKSEWFVGSTRIVPSQEVVEEPLELETEPDPAEITRKTELDTSTQVESVETVDRSHGSLESKLTPGIISSEIDENQANTSKQDNAVSSGLAGLTEAPEAGSHAEDQVLLSQSDIGSIFQTLDMASTQELVNDFLMNEIHFSSAQGPYMNGKQLQEVVEEPCIKRSASRVSLSEGETGNDSSKSEATGLDTLSADTIDKATVKLSKPEEVIEKMAQLRDSKSSERILSAEPSLDEPIVRPMSSLQEQASLDIEDGDIIVYNRLQRDETRESSAQSDSVVFGEAESDKILDRELATEEESGRVHLMRHYTIAGDDPRGLFRSVTIDDALSYGEMAEKDLDSSLGINSTNSFYLDDETSENIRKKMMAYSLSETDSDYFDPKKMSKEDFDIDTAMADAMGTSTETESTIVSAATKIQAGARGFLTRRRLRRASAGTKSSTMDTKASFGNDAISESLERFIEEEAAKKIQAAYRIHTRKRKGNPHRMEGISLESNLAARRQKLQRGDALRNDSTPDDENSGSTNSGQTQKLLKNEKRTKAVGEAKSRAAMELKWLTMRQNSMPVQIDCEVFRVIPKHMRKRIKSAEAGKRK